MTEIWKSIEGFEAYEVSNLGRIKRIASGMGATVGRVLRSCITKRRYATVTLVKDTKKHTKNIHTLVAKAFVPNPLGLPEVNHLGPKSDNRAWRLEWQTREGNVEDSVQRGLQGDGVYYDRFKQKWVAHHSVDKKLKCLGFFITKREALIARREALA
jgi:hypothetical protein